MSHGPDPAPSINVYGLTCGEFSAYASTNIARGSGAAPELYKLLFRYGGFMRAAAELKLTRPDDWSAVFSFMLPKIVDRIDEESDSGITTKVILETRDGHSIECVRIPMPGGDDNRTTLCISSQIGCGRGCAFCQTGSMGLVRDLEASEIVGQVVALESSFGWHIRNIVFMGMGEPLDNFENTVASLNVFHDQRGLNFAWERITLCTSGSIAGIGGLRKLGLKRLGLSISLNGARDELRDALMPSNRTCGIDSLVRVLGEYPQRRNFVLGVNYCLLPGINDSREDARAVAVFCARVGRTLLNLIPYNPGSVPLTHAPDEAEIATFQRMLEESGVIVRRRALKGSRIMAGCGQLGGAVSPHRDWLPAP